jgi:hypothetical protein
MCMSVSWKVFMYKPSSGGTEEQSLMAKDRARNIICETGNLQPTWTRRNNTFGSKLCDMFVQ